MKEKDFPIFKTKVPGVTQKFNLADPAERKNYFEQKAGDAIKRLKEHLENKTFVAFLLGKKNSGKGTYSKLVKEILGKDKIGHISVGDIVREAHAAMDNPAKKKEIMEYLAKNYRGYISVEDAITALLNRSAKNLLPSELILTLIKMEIAKMPKKSLFIDGFPRELDQVSYSLFLRDLINFRDDQDLLVGISIPESVIDERMKNRVICPICHTPRSQKLLPTNKVEYDEKNNKFYLICDDEKCGGARMVGKEGDDLGIEALRERLELDGKLIERAFDLHGIPKIYLRNAIPISLAKDYADDYEITPAYSYEFNGGKVEIKENPWIIKDDEGIDSYSLLAPPVALALIKQLADILVPAEK
ncbi:MAG: nucleoside monophosphate kinase [Candidatus Portnoybacteria bacterium]|nr:nucleoside monophosphate kinase [Candidatus Portnoybacteria bacterium]